MKRDYYEILGVAKDADDQGLKSAYRKLALQHHPDRNPGNEEAVNRFKEAAEAFEILSDPEKRALYDRYGHAGVSGRNGGGEGFHDISDIFEAFGDLFGGGGRARQGRRGERLHSEN